MSTETVSIELNLAERNTLAHLLKNYIDNRPWEDLRGAESAHEIAEAAERARLLAQIHSLAEHEDSSLPLADLDAHRTNLTLWALETESTVVEHLGLIAEQGEDEHERELIVIDYAHACVCEKIVGQIDAARELVTA